MRIQIGDHPSGDRRSGSDRGERADEPIRSRNKRDRDSWAGIALEQRTAGDVQTVLQLLTSEQAATKTLSDAVAALQTKVDALRRPVVLPAPRAFGTIADTAGPLHQPGSGPVRRDKARSRDAQDCRNIQCRDPSAPGTTRFHALRMLP